MSFSRSKLFVQSLHRIQPLNDYLHDTHGDEYEVFSVGVVRMGTNQVIGKIILRSYCEEPETAVEITRFRHWKFLRVKGVVDGNRAVLTHIDEQDYVDRLPSIHAIEDEIAGTYVWPHVGISS